MRPRSPRATSLFIALLLVAVVFVASIAALVLRTPIPVQASTIGNTDQLEAGTDIQSAIWGSNTYRVSQRYGCTGSSFETYIDASAPSWAQACVPQGYNYWHHGIDIDGANYPVGIPLYAIRSGTINTVPDDPNSSCPSNKGIFAETASNGNVIFYLHGTAAPNTYQGQPVRAGDEVSLSNSVAPCGPGGASTGPHLHLEVHTSVPLLYGSGLWDDINPEGWLKALVPGGPVVSWSPNRLDLFVRGLNYGYWHRASGDGGTNWGAWENHLSPNSGSTAFESQPVGGSWAPTRLDIFGIGADYNLWHQYWTGVAWGPAPPPGSQPYQGWEQVPNQPSGVQLVGNPALTSWASNRMDIVVRDSQGELWQTCLSDSGWCTWVMISGGLYATSDPAITTWGPGRLDVLARFSGNIFDHTYYDGGSWHNWDSLGRPSDSSLATVPTLVTWDSPLVGGSAHHLEIFGTGYSQNVYQLSWTGTAWTPWAVVPPNGNPGYGLTGPAAVVSWTSARLDLFVRDSVNHEAWHNSYNNAPWAGWDERFGVFNSDILSEVTWGPNRLDIFGVGQLSGIWWEYWNGYSWSGWISLGGQVT